LIISTPALRPSALAALPIRSRSAPRLEPVFTPRRGTPHDARSGSAPCAKPIGTMRPPSIFFR
ncbi:MAG: hypothetical protein K2G76_03940, partial [Prevotella sp.]|nr:hypothetical protein [Prevotella sp.]